MGPCKGYAEAKPSCKSITDKVTARSMVGEGKMGLKKKKKKKIIGSRRKHVGSHFLVIASLFFLLFLPSPLPFSFFLLGILRILRRSRSITSFVPYLFVFSLYKSIIYPPNESRLY